MDFIFITLPCIVESEAHMIHSGCHSVTILRTVYSQIYCTCANILSFCGLHTAASMQNQMLTAESLQSFIPMVLQNLCDVMNVKIYSCNLYLLKSVYYAGSSNNIGDCKLTWNTNTRNIFLQTSLPPFRKWLINGGVIELVYRLVSITCHIVSWLQWWDQNKMAVITRSVFRSVILDELGFITFYNREAKMARWCCNKAPL